MTRGSRPSVTGDSRVQIQTARRAATNYRDGEAASFDGIVKYVASQFAYMAEVERCKARIGGRKDLSHVALRVTSVFRREEGVWKLAHRHTDPITLGQTAESVIQK